MKKFILTIIAVASLLTACSSGQTEQKANEYLQQMTELTKSGKTSDIIMLGIEYQQWMETLSPEEKAIAEPILKEADKVAEKFMFGNLKEDLNDMTNDGKSNLDSLANKAANYLKDMELKQK